MKRDNDFTVTINYAFDSLFLTIFRSEAILIGKEHAIRTYCPLYIGLSITEAMHKEPIVSYQRT